MSAMTAYRQPRQDSYGVSVDDVREVKSQYAALTPTTGTVTIDMATAQSSELNHGPLTGTVTYQTSNGADGQSAVIWITGAASGSTTLNFPAGWVFVGAAPTAIAATKLGKLEIQFRGGGTAASVVAKYAVQA